MQGMRKCEAIQKIKHFIMAASGFEVIIGKCGWRGKHGANQEDLSSPVQETEF